MNRHDRSIPALILLSLLMTTADAKPYKEVTGFEHGEAVEWRPINDGVMGGLSRSALTLTPEGTGVFEGEVSLANNGGFASTRGWLGSLDLSEFQGIALRLKGDGKRYRLRFHNSSAIDSVAYQATFRTESDTWTEVFVPFTDFTATFRGRKPAHSAPLDKSNVQQIGLMIADKQAGPFRLELDWIRARDIKLADGADSASEAD